MGSAALVATSAALPRKGDQNYLQELNMGMMNEAQKEKKKEKNNNRKTEEEENSQKPNRLKALQTYSANECRDPT